jgi:two-component system, OmpR family, response regulator
MSKILLIEDSPDCRLLVSSALSGIGEIHCAPTLGEAKAFLAKSSFDLLVIDVNLPDGNGFQFCSALLMEKQAIRPRIFFLTGKAEIADKLLGYAIGADDYLAKPFEPLELRARVKAMLRSAQAAESGSQSLAVGNLLLTPSSLKAELVGGAEPHLLSFTPTEFKLLYCLAKQEGQIFTRDQLMNALSEGRIHVLDRTIDSHISRARKKLSGCTHTVESIYGVGYRFAKGG